MQPEYQPRIMIDPSIEGNYYHAATEAASGLDSLIREDPQASAEVIRQFQSELTAPIAPTEAFRDIDPSETHRAKVARTVAKLLSSTDHGGFIEHDDRTYGTLASDKDHGALVAAAQNHERRRGEDPRLARSRVALSGLHAYIRTWHSGNGHGTATPGAQERPTASMA